MWACSLTRLCRGKLINHLNAAARNNTKFLWHFKSFFHSLLQKQETPAKRCVFNPDKVYESIDVSCCVWGHCSTRKRQHLCGIVQIMQRGSSRCTAGSFSSPHLRSNHILSDDFPANFFNPLISPQLIASLLQSPIMDSILSASHFWCFQFTVVVLCDGASTERQVRNNLALIRQLRQDQQPQKLWCCSLHNPICYRRLTESNIVLDLQQLPIFAGEIKK